MPGVAICRVWPCHGPRRDADRRERRSACAIEISATAHFPGFSTVSTSRRWSEPAPSVGFSPPNTPRAPRSEWRAGLRPPRREQSGDGEGLAGKAASPSSLKLARIQARWAPSTATLYRHSGTSLASRDLGLDPLGVHRDEDTAEITPQAREAARVAGLDDNRSKLLVAAAEPTGK